jgi:hypothetical protein
MRNKKRETPETDKARDGIVRPYGLMKQIIAHAEQMEVQRDMAIEREEVLLKKLHDFYNNKNKDVDKISNVS